jgi:hypothetical protein
MSIPIHHLPPFAQCAYKKPFKRIMYAAFLLLVSFYFTHAEIRQPDPTPHLNASIHPNKHIPFLLLHQFASSLHTSLSNSPCSSARLNRSSRALIGLATEKGLVAELSPLESQSTAFTGAPHHLIRKIVATSSRTKEHTEPIFALFPWQVWCAMSLAHPTLPVFRQRNIGTKQATHS